MEENAPVGKQREGRDEDGKSWLVVGEIAAYQRPVRLIIEASSLDEAVELVESLGVQHAVGVEEDRSEDSKIRRLVVRAGIAVGSIWLLYVVVCLTALFVFRASQVTEQEGGPGDGLLQQLASLGDAFGSANALFSGLAFIGVIAAILMQRSELALQRRDLRLQYAEMHKSTAAHESNAAASVEQLNLMKENLALEQAKEPKRKSVELFTRWQEIREDRNRVREWLVQDVGVDQLPSDRSAWSEWLAKRETAESLSQLWRQSKDHSVKKALHDSAYTIINFFERWSLLEQAGEIDPALLRKMMMAHPGWWKGRFIDVLLRLEQDDGSLQNLLRLIMEGPLSDIVPA